MQPAAYVTLGTVLGAGSMAALNARSNRRTKSVPNSGPSTALIENPLEKKAAPEVAEQPAPELMQALSYQEFLAQFQLRHILTNEIIAPHYSTTAGVANTLPPPELWSAMPATLFVADEIRERLGRPLKLITSAYRNPRYNQVCGGASQSWHTKNCALDLVFEGGPREPHAIAQELRDSGFFQGGIGLYNSFIHIDSRGENVSWRG